jgi:hemolysin type calcium-binding protein
VGRVALALLAATAVLAIAAPAQAATVSLEFLGRSSAGPHGEQNELYRLNYAAAPGEANRLTLDTADYPNVRVRDTGAPLGPGAGCHTDGASVLCVPAGLSATVSEDEIDLGDGADTAVVQGSTGHVRAGSGADELLVEGHGSFELDGGAGGDVMRAEACCSIITYADRTQGVTVTPDGVANDGAPGEGDDVGPAFSVIRGGSGNDELHAPTPMYATLDGRAGDDRLFGGPRGDSLSGGDGDDVLSGGDGPDTLEGDAGADVTRGDDGVDSVFYSDHTMDVTVALDEAGGDGAPGEGDDVRSDVENVSTGVGDDTVVGSAASNRLVGGAGDDGLDGAAGDDTIVGGGGTNHLVGGAGGDRLSADGADTIDARDGERDTIDCSWPANGPLDGDPIDSADGCAPVPFPLGPIKVRTGRSGKFAFRLQCPGGVDIPCPGKLVLRTRRGGKIDSQTMRFPSGSAIVRFRFRLGPKLLRALVRDRRMQVFATATGRRQVPASTRELRFPVDLRAPRR